MASKAENTQSDKVLADLMKGLTVSKDASDVKAASTAIASFINGRIEDIDVPTKYVSLFRRCMFCCFAPSLQNR